MDSEDVFIDPDADRYFEDYQPGAQHQFGPIEVNEEEIVSFAKRYDPQSFHTDRTRAGESHFGGLIASGWHTAGLMMRLFAQHYLSEASSLGSPGIDELRWHLPVRPGDQLSIRVSVLEARRSRSKPDRGVVKTLIEVLRQDGQVVMTLKAINMFKTRDC